MKHQWKPLLPVAYVFIFAGSVICMNDVLLPSLKDFFHLSYVQASFVQQSFYLVYLVFPIPIAYYISRPVNFFNGNTHSPKCIILPGKNILIDRISIL